MTTHRFFIKEILAEETITITDLDLIGQWQKVLRFKEGAGLNLIDINGLEAEVEILSLTKDKAVVKVVNILAKRSFEWSVNLGLAILKKENFELVVQKATEIGVTSITPLITERTVKLGLNLERLNRIVTEASEQSGRQDKLVINESLTLDQYLNKLPQGLTVVLSLQGKEQRVLSDKETANFNLLVGPEGGWSEAEEKEMVSKGVILKSLGKQTLRAETAAVVAAYLAVHNLL